MDFQCYYEKEKAELVKEIAEAPAWAAKLKSRLPPEDAAEFIETDYISSTIEYATNQLNELKYQKELYDGYNPSLQSMINEHIKILRELEAIDEMRNKSEVDAWVEDIRSDIEMLLENPQVGARSIRQRLDLALGNKKLSDVLREAGLIQTDAFPSHIPGHTTKIFRTP